MKTLLMTLLLFFSAWANAGIYKWTDENGKVHYGDKPTTSGERLDIRVKESTAAVKSDESREERRQRITDSMTDDRLARDNKNAEDKKKKAYTNRLCVQSKDHLKNYKRASRLYDLDKEGNRNTLSDKSRKKAISNLQTEIRKHCK